MNVPPIDAAQADRFLSLLGKDPATARLRAFPHRDNPRKWNPKTNPNGIRARKGPYNLHEANSWQQGERGVYLVTGDGGDDDADITACRAFFLEWDDKPVTWQLTAWHEYGLGEPTFIVTTGGKSAHLYWTLQEPLPPDEWRPVQTALIELTGADPANKNPSRVMRLPGAHYIGPDGTPIGQSAIYCASGKTYSLADVLEWLEPDEFADPPQQVSASRPRIDITGDTSSGELPPRPPETLRDALLQIPPFRHGAGQYEQLVKLAMRLHVDLGPADAQALLADTCCRDIRDLPSYFQGTPNKISPGSTWPFLRDEWNVDISRRDLKGKRPPPHREPSPDRDDDTDTSQQPARLTLDEIRIQLQQAVADGASRQELEAMRLTLAAAADIQPAALRDLLRSIELEHDAAQSIAAEVASIKAAADRRDIGQALTLDWICPPSLAAALRIRCRSLPADDVAALATYLITVSGCVKLGTQVVASEAADYRVPLNLYGALVARSGAKKSPLSRLLVNAPTHDLRLELAQQNSRARKVWEDDNRGVKPAERSPEPQPVYLSISDFTCEALAEQLQVQESRGMGLLINRDELAGMFGNLNRYHSGRGGDEEQLLEAYDGSGFSSLRIAKIGGGRFYDRCHLSIYGTIQPAVLAELVKAGDASGLWARFMFVPLPERVVPIAETETVEEQEQATWAADTLAALCRYVYTLPKCSLVLSPAARRIFVAYEARCQADVHRTTLGAQGALLGKAAGKVLRVAALLHLLHQGCADGWHSDQVSDEVMHRACVLVDHINTWTLSLHQQVAEGANDLMRLIHRIALAKGTATWRNIYPALGRSQRREIDSATAAAAMKALEELGVGVVEISSRGTPTYRATEALP